MADDAPTLDALRIWPAQRSTTEPFGTAVDSDAVEFFGVEQLRETTIGSRRALGFYHDAMGIRISTTIAAADGAVISLSKTHVGQFQFEPVYEMMRNHITFMEDLDDD